MRTVVAVLMVLAALALVGCGGGQQEQPAAPAQPEAPAAPAQPEAPATAPDQAAPAAPAAAVQYTCTMHPEVVTDAPGNCPKCNMALVPKQ